MNIDIIFSIIVAILIIIIVICITIRTRKIQNIENIEENFKSIINDIKTVEHLKANPVSLQKVLNKNNNSNNDGPNQDLEFKVNTNSSLISDTNNRITNNENKINEQHDFLMWTCQKIKEILTVTKQKDTVLPPYCNKTN